MDYEAIKKALECFATEKDFDIIYCRGCAFESSALCCENASEGLARASLALIEYQRAEIERLREKYDRVMHGLKAVLEERAADNKDDENDEDDEEDLNWYDWRDEHDYNED